MILIWLLRPLIVVSVSTLLDAQTTIDLKTMSRSFSDSTTSSRTEISNKPSGEPSVRYIESSIFGDFFLALGKTINDTSVNSVMMVKKECECRFQCLTNTSCMAVSSEVKGTDFLCKFAKLGPMETTIDDTSDKRATYIYRHASLTGKTWGFRQDKLYYFEFPNWMSFPEGKMACQRIPGFRLVIIRSKEVMMSLVTKERAYYVDLHKKTGGRLVWGDSTPFDNPGNIDIRTVIPFTSDSTEPFPRPVFILLYTFLHDQILGNSERIVCQANPFGVDW